MNAVVLLARIASKIRLLHTPEVQDMDAAERHRVLAGPPKGEYFETIGRRFSASEAEILGRRFAALDLRLAADAALVHQRYAAVHAGLLPEADAPPDFESRPLRQFHCHMPDGFGMDELVGGWRDPDARC